jgi:hypothetical protein
LALLLAADGFALCDLPISESRAANQLYAVPAAARPVGFLGLAALLKNWATAGTWKKPLIYPKWNGFQLSESSMMPMR